MEFRSGFRRLGAAFWMMIGFGFLCALAGLVIGRFGPRLFPVKPPAAVSAPPASRTLGNPAPPR